MGKNPAFQFYPSDWTRDLDAHPLEIEGAWIRIICTLWWETPHRGKATKDLEEWARILGIDQVETQRILRYLGDKKIGEIKFTVTRNANVTASHKKITVMSRRMYRKERLREFNRLRQQRFRSKRQSNARVTPPSSVLHTSKKERPRKVSVEDRNGTVKIWNPEKGEYEEKSKNDKKGKNPKT